MGSMIGTGLYALLMVVFSVMNLAWASRGIKQPEAFCAGTTGAYRKGNDVNSFNKCHGEDICSGIDWDKVQADAEAGNVFGGILRVLTFVLMIGTLVLIVKKHAKGLNIACKVLAAMPLLYILVPIINAAVAAPAQALRSTGNEFYEMAAKDYVCGNNMEQFVDPAKFLSAWIKKPSATEIADPKYCKDPKFIGAPDPTDDLKDSWGFDPCVGVMPMMMIMPFIWYFVFYIALYSYLVFNIWSLKEELAGAPKDDTEMGAAKPAVAVATATATAAA